MPVGGNPTGGLRGPGASGRPQPREEPLTRPACSDTRFDAADYTAWNRVVHGWSMSAIPAL